MDAKKETEALSRSLEDGLLKIDKLLCEDKDLINNSGQVVQSVEETIRLCSKTNAKEHLKDITKRTKCVKLVKGWGSQDFIGRVGGLNEKWELAHKFTIPTTLRGPRIVGFMSPDRIAISDFKLTDLYEVSSMNGEFKKVVSRKSVSCVISCSPLKDDVTVCGRWTKVCSGAMLDGNIVLYDQRWRPMKIIQLGDECSTSSSKVCVDVDREGKILAAEVYQKTIYVLDPSDGAVVSTIHMGGDKTITGAVQALRTGDIVVRTGNAEFTIVDRTGYPKRTISSKEWTLALCNVDPLTDLLYITHRSRERNNYAVDIVTSDGAVQERDIVKFEWSLRHVRSPFMSPALVTPNGSLVCCDGNSLLVFKKSLVF